MVLASPSSTYNTQGAAGGVTRQARQARHRCHHLHSSELSLVSNEEQLLVGERLRPFITAEGGNHQRMHVLEVVHGVLVFFDAVHAGGADVAHNLRRTIRSTQQSGDSRSRLYAQADESTHRLGKLVPENVSDEVVDVLKAPVGS